MLWLRLGLGNPLWLQNPHKDRSTRMCESVFVGERVEGHKSFPLKRDSVAEAMHVFCRHSPHMKQADKKRSLTSLGFRNAAQHLHQSQLRLKNATAFLC